jgi:hypothetical protein
MPNQVPGKLRYRVSQRRDTLQVHSATLLPPGKYVVLIAFKGPKQIAIRVGRDETRGDDRPKECVNRRKAAKRHIDLETINPMHAEAYPLLILAGAEDHGEHVR